MQSGMSGQLCLEFNRIMVLISFPPPPHRRRRRRRHEWRGRIQLPICGVEELCALCASLAAHHLCLFDIMQDCITDGEPLCIRQFLLDGDYIISSTAPRPETTIGERSISHTIAWLDDAAPVEKGSVDDPYKLFDSMGARALVDGDRFWYATSSVCAPPLHRLHTD
jgi:hypothetical protein